jgi:hypothetical protein
MGEMTITINQQHFEALKKAIEALRKKSHVIEILKTTPADSNYIIVTIIAAYPISYYYLGKEHRKQIDLL